MTTPVPTDPLLTLERLAVWAQERPLLDVELAEAIIDAVSVLLRQYGSAAWTAANLPPRARDIGYIVAKDYYLNPRQLRQETTGPLQESLDASVLRGINLTEEQKAELAALVNGQTPAEFDGLWVMSTTRGPVEMSRNIGRRPGPYLLAWDERHAWPIEYLTPEDADAMTPPEEVV